MASWPLFTKYLSATWHKYLDKLFFLADIKLRTLEIIMDVAETGFSLLWSGALKKSYILKVSDQTCWFRLSKWILLLCRLYMCPSPRFILTSIYCRSSTDTCIFKCLIYKAPTDMQKLGFDAIILLGLWFSCSGGYMKTGDFKILILDNVYRNVKLCLWMSTHFCKTSTSISVIMWNIW